jgi:hypothetical protein
MALLKESSFFTPYYHKGISKIINFGTGYGRLLDEGWEARMAIFRSDVTAVIRKYYTCRVSDVSPERYCLQSTARIFLMV